MNAPRTQLTRAWVLLVVGIVGLTMAGRAWAGFEEGAAAWGKQDYTTALQEFLASAQQGDAASQYMLCNMYRHGQGVPEDYVLAVQWCHKAAEQGDAEAQLSLGVIYFMGEGGAPQDYTLAIQWYRRALEQGYAPAQLYLGVMYEKGDGVPKDYALAAQWYRRAAEQGYEAAQIKLGEMYTEGRGVPQDFAQAYFWFNLAVVGFSFDAQREIIVRKRDAIAARLTPTQLASAQEQARVWQPKPVPLETGSSKLWAVLAASRDLPTPQHGSVPRVTPVLSAPSSPRRALIRQVQQHLQAQGFSPGAIDGSLGPQTQKALRWFQNSKGLLPSGELDEKTLDALGVQ